MRSDSIRHDKTKVESYYTDKTFLDKVTTGLEKIGKNIDSITAEDLAPIEDLHLRAREATIELLKLLNPDENTKILDIGFGIGGTSRYIASTYKSKITGIDLSAEHLSIAEELTKKTGLDHKIDFRQGDATAMPFDDEEFDMAVSMHIQMNIQNKKAYIEETYRILKYGGKFGIYEIFKQGTEPLVYPLPWAADKSISYLVSWEKFKEMLVSAGFEKEFERDTSEIGLNWLKPNIEKMNNGGLPPFGQHLFMGDSAKDKMNNFFDNLENHRVNVMQAVYRKL